MVRIARRKLLSLAAGGAALPVVSRIGKAEGYPAQPVRVIVGFAAGGTPDIRSSRRPASSRIDGEPQ
jgi:tripartite-type tricarboxylate transporter receptor subunit TctC